MTEKITQAELAKLFGEYMPIEALQVIGSRVLSGREIRHKLRELAAKWPEPSGAADPPDGPTEWSWTPEQASALLARLVALEAKVEALQAALEDPVEIARKILDMPLERYAADDTPIFRKVNYGPDDPRFRPEAQRATEETVIPWSGDGRSQP